MEVEEEGVAQRYVINYNHGYPLHNEQRQRQKRKRWQRKGLHHRAMDEPSPLDPRIRKRAVHQQARQDEKVGDANTTGSSLYRSNPANQSQSARHDFRRYPESPQQTNEYRQRQTPQRGSGGFLHPGERPVRKDALNGDHRTEHRPRHTATTERRIAQNQSRYYDRSASSSSSSSERKSPAPLRGVHGIISPTYVNNNHCMTATPRSGFETSRKSRFDGWTEASSSNRRNSAEKDMEERLKAGTNPSRPVIGEKPLYVPAPVGSSHRHMQLSVPRPAVGADQLKTVILEELSTSEEETKVVTSEEENKTLKSEEKNKIAKPAVKSILKKVSRYGDNPDKEAAFNKQRARAHEEKRKRTESSSSEEEFRKKVKECSSDLPESIARRLQQITSLDVLRSRQNYKMRKESASMSGSEKSSSREREIDNKLTESQQPGTKGNIQDTRTQTHQGGSKVQKAQVERKRKQPDIDVHQKQVVRKLPEVNSQETQVVRKLPEVNSQETQVVRKLPEVNGQATEIVRKLPEVNGEATEIVRQLPEANGQETQVVRELPVVDGKETQVVRELPVVDSQETDIVLQRPQANGQEPQIVRQLPEDNGQETQVVRELPVVDGQGTDIVLQLPETNGQEPQIVRQLPEVNGQETQVVRNLPVVDGQETEIVLQLPETNGQEPQIVRQLPEVNGQETQVVRNLPLVDGQETEIVLQLPEANGQETQVVRELPVVDGQETQVVRELPVVDGQETQIVRELPVVAGQETEIVLQLPETNCKETQDVRKLPVFDGQETEIVLQLPETNGKETQDVRKLPVVDVQETEIVLQLPETNCQETLIVRRLPEANGQEIQVVRKLPVVDGQGTEIVLQLPETNCQETQIVRQLPEANGQETQIVLQLPEASTQETQIVLQLPEASTQETQIVLQLPEASTLETQVVRELPVVDGQGTEIVRQVPEASTQETQVVRQLPETNCQENAKEGEDNEQVAESNVEKGEVERAMKVAHEFAAGVTSIPSGKVHVHMCAAERVKRRCRERPLAPFQQPRPLKRKPSKSSSSIMKREVAVTSYIVSPRYTYIDTKCSILAKKLSAEVEAYINNNGFIRVSDLESLNMRDNGSIQAGSSGNQYLKGPDTSSSQNSPRSSDETTGCSSTNARNTGRVASLMSDLVASVQENVVVDARAIEQAHGTEHYFQEQTPVLEPLLTISNTDSAAPATVASVAHTQENHEPFRLDSDVENRTLTSVCNGIGIEETVTKNNEAVLIAPSSDNKDQNAHAHHSNDFEDLMIVTLDLPEVQECGETDAPDFTSTESETVMLSDNTDIVLSVTEVQASNYCSKTSTNSMDILATPENLALTSAAHPTVTDSEVNVENSREVSLDPTTQHNLVDTVTESSELREELEGSVKNSNLKTLTLSDEAGSLPVANPVIVADRANNEMRTPTASSALPIRERQLTPRLFIRQDIFEVDENNANCDNNGQTESSDDILSPAMNAIGHMQDELNSVFEDFMTKVNKRKQAGTGDSWGSLVATAMNNINETLHQSLRAIRTLDERLSSSSGYAEQRVLAIGRVTVDEKLLAARLRQELTSETLVEYFKALYLAFQLKNYRSPFPVNLKLPVEMLYIRLLQIVRFFLFDPVDEYAEARFESKMSMIFSMLKGNFLPLVLQELTAALRSWNDAGNPINPQSVESEIKDVGIKCFQEKLMNLKEKIAPHAKTNTQVTPPPQPLPPESIDFRARAAQVDRGADRRGRAQRVAGAPYAPRGRGSSVFRTQQLVQSVPEVSRVQPRAEVYQPRCLPTQQAYQQQPQGIAYGYGPPQQIPRFTINPIQVTPRFSQQPMPQIQGSQAHPMQAHSHQQPHGNFNHQMRGYSQPQLLLPQGSQQQQVLPSSRQSSTSSTGIVNPQVVGLPPPYPRVATFPALPDQLTPQQLQQIRQQGAAKIIQLEQQQQNLSSRSLLQQQNCQPCQVEDRIHRHVVDHNQALRVQAEHARYHRQIQENVQQQHREEEARRQGKEEARRLMALNARGRQCQQSAGTATSAQPQREAADYSTLTLYSLLNSIRPEETPPPPPAADDGQELTIVENDEEQTVELDMSVRPSIAAAAAAVAPVEVVVGGMDGPSTIQLHYLAPSTTSSAAVTDATTANNRYSLYLSMPSLSPASSSGANEPPPPPPPAS